MHEPPENMQDESMPEAEGYAGSSFSVPVELAAQYKYGSYSPPEAILGSPEFDEDLQRWIEGDASTQNAIDPSVPPPRSATLEEIAEATKDLPPERQARITRFAYGPRPNQAMAIALSLAAEFPGMFAGPDVLRPVALPAIDAHAQATVDRLARERLERGVARQIAAEAHVVVDSVPPGEKRPYRGDVRPYRGGKPAGSKLARKAARGKL